MYVFRHTPLRPIGRLITASGLFKAVGITDEGYPKWVQPVGASDAYMKGDIVDYEGVLYISLMDNNVWSPAAYPSAWQVYTGDSNVSEA